MKGETAILDPEYVKFLQQANKGSKPTESAPANANMRRQIGSSSIRLPKSEYAHVMSELNGMYHSRLQGKTRELVPIDNHLYEIEIGGFDDYRIIARYKLD